MASAPRDPFEVPLNPDQKAYLGLWACDEVQRGIDARSAVEQDVEYWWALYEQARTRNKPPWPDAADLTSYLGSEKTDALHARIMKTVWTEPLWNVEGWGEASERAPAVEEFHTWKAEEERLQSVIDRLVLQALVEPRGLLEIYESSEVRVSRKNFHAQQDTTADGLGVLDEDGSPLPKRDPATGALVEATDSTLPSIDMVVDETARVRTGPGYRILPYRDSLVLPAHARDREDIWGYGKRYRLREDTLRARAKAKIYDAEVVDKMRGSSDEVGNNQALERAHVTVAPAGDKNQFEHELWELLVLVDLANLLDTRDLGTSKKALKGERWYLLTVHLPTMRLLRVQFDDMERSRFVMVNLFPRVDRATEGYSFIGHKLLTTIEEHTAWRNLAADRASMANQAPIKRVAGALWDPEVQPWGPRAVIDVRDLRELEPMVVPDVTNSVMTHIRMQEQTAERLAGVNDIASGQLNTESRTLGEVQMADAGSAVRMDLIVRRFQEAFEEVGSIRHAIWKRVMAEKPDGEDAPTQLVNTLEGRGVSIDRYLPDKKITSQLLEGAFRFKPHGSVETADSGRLRSDFVAAMQFMPMLLQAFPQLQVAFRSDAAARAMARLFVHLFRIPNQQAFLGSPAQDLQLTQQAQMHQLFMQPPQPPGMPGMAPGMPPGPPGMGQPGPQVIPPMPGRPPMGGPPGLPLGMPQRPM